MAYLFRFYAPQVEVREALQSELQGKSDARDENVSTLNHDIVELRSELSRLEGNLPTLQRDIEDSIWSRCFLLQLVSQVLLLLQSTMFNKCREQLSTVQCSLALITFILTSHGLKCAGQRRLCATSVRRRVRVCVCVCFVLILYVLHADDSKPNFNYVISMRNCGNVGCKRQLAPFLLSSPIFAYIFRTWDVFRFCWA